MVLPCSGAPVSQPPRNVNMSYCAIMARMPEGAHQERYHSQRMKCVIHTDSPPDLPNIRKLHTYEKGSMEHTVAQLILLQNANGSWDMNEDLAKVLGTSLEDMKAVHPTEGKYGEEDSYNQNYFIKTVIYVLEPSAWATMLAVIWLHANGKELKCEWELLERKAVVWLHNNTVRGFTRLMRTANKFLNTTVSACIFTLKD
ncbi:von Willebrand factor A domain-containing protein 5A-like protein [Cricetulus griseus]|uniref:von Willebrand factor A domain-containing protein 5A-like protein n=1 Tax=Cricetulus griseus TaxID=10029 RepID=A0A061I8X7_CRIGR|nr:von Willebrand factor A domain-containing protein 5A-like protein [Cricetulus griseus]